MALLRIRGAHKKQGLKSQELSIVKILALTGIKF